MYPAVAKAKLRAVQSANGLIYRKLIVRYFACLADSGSQSPFNRRARLRPIHQLFSVQPVAELPQFRLNLIDKPVRVDVSLLILNLLDIDPLGLERELLL